MALLVDSQACLDFPMLKEHRIGLDISMLCRLLVPLASHRRLLASIEGYVRARDKAAKYPSVINPDVDSSSFGVRFSKMRADMTEAHAAVQGQCRVNQLTKRKEVEEKLVEYKALMDLVTTKTKEAASMGCSYYTSRLAQKKSSFVLLS